MNKIKRVASLAVICAILLSLAVPAALSDGGSVYVRKHVSILYDNSYSMRDGATNLKWCYASYAVQVFTGLLNDSDSLSITMMNENTLGSIDLRGSRQAAVDAVLNATKVVRGHTPISSITQALNVLKAEELQPGLGTNQPGEQYWLVLTTDGRFTDDANNLCKKETVVSRLLGILEDYPDLNLVYVGIGTEHDDSEERAWDFRPGSEDPFDTPDLNNGKTHADFVNDLNSYPNFYAFYSETQAGIVDTMRSLSNRISGRYSVTNDCTVNGNEVTMHLSSEGSPMRNIALLAQNTNAHLVSAVSEHGGTLEVNRSAQINYPYVADYAANMPTDTAGGYVALVTGPNGEKIPSGNVTLTFSEPVSKEDLALMYEPAVFVRLNVERKNANGGWEPIDEYTDLTDGDEIRVDYEICEEGTGYPLDVDSLFGDTETTLLFNGRQIEVGESVTVEKGDSILDIRVSMMNGDYQINRTRTFHVNEPGAEDLDVQSSGPIELRRSEAANNEQQHVDFTVSFRGAPAGDEFTSRLTIETAGETSGKLNGTVELLPGSVIRFTPKDDGCKAGAYTVKLLYDGTEICSEAMTILPNETTFTAEALNSISITSNHVSDNAEPLVFAVTAHRDEDEGPITEEESKLFRVVSDGAQIGGVTAFDGDGRISFTPKDPSAVPGEYSVSLWKDEQKLAEAHFSIVRYDAVFTIEAVVSSPDKVERFKLHENEACVSFIVYEDGEPISAAQLENMLDQQIFITSSVKSRLMKLNVEVGSVNGKPAIVCTPGATAKNGFTRFFHNIYKAYGALSKGTIDVTARVDALHGCTDTGTLQLVGYDPLYLLPPLILLALLILFGVWYAANRLMVRFTKGTLYTFRLEFSEYDNHYSVEGVDSETTGAGIRLMPTNRERTEINGVSFEATPSKTELKKAWRRVSPTLSVNDKVSELKKYVFVQAPDPDSAEVINGIINGSTNHITRAECSCLQDGTELSENIEFSSDEGKSYTISKLMKNGSLLIRDESSDLSNQYYCWCYKLRNDGAGAHRPRISLFDRFGKYRD